MPIKPENKHRYPDNWPEIRERIRARANDKCEKCGVVNHSYINRFTREICLQDEENAIKVVCTTAHKNHIPEDNRDENLAFWCQKCHNVYDAPHRRHTRMQAKYAGCLEIEFKQ